MDISNLVTYAELFQLLAIFSGAWLAILSLMGSLAAAWYIRDSNRRDRDNERRHAVAQELNDRRHAVAQELNERRHQELLGAIGLLYHHVHADGTPAIVPLPDVDPAVPAPADN